ESAVQAGLSDGERPLTRSGEQRIRAVAEWLRSERPGGPVEVLLTSPLLRARQTAEILATYLDDPPVDEVDALVPGTTMEAIDQCLHEHFGKQQLLLVGHEPSLPGWIS